MEFVEAVDIMPKVPANFHEAMGSSKWKDRKEVLDALLEALKAAPKIADSDGHGELAKALAKRMTDANIMCVIAAANCIEALAKGVGQSFGRHRSSLVNPMLERLKERKVNVTDAIGAGLDAVFLTVHIIRTSLAIILTESHVDDPTRRYRGYSELSEIQESSSQGRNS